MLDVFKAFLILIEALSKDTGICEAGYNAVVVLTEHLYGEPTRKELEKRVDATDGGFYFKTKEDYKKFIDITVTQGSAGK